MSSTARVGLRAGTAAVLALALTACAGGSSGGGGDAAPRKSTEKPAEKSASGTPSRIAALSVDTANAVADLVGTDRLIAVTRSSQNATLSTHSREFTHVEHKTPPGNRPDPEVVLSWNPDLVVLPARYAGEKRTAETLTKAGLRTVALPGYGDSLDQIHHNLNELGTVLGARPKAEELVSSMKKRTEEITGKVAGVQHKPSVLILSNQAATPFINASTALTSDLVLKAGGTLAAEKAGVTTTRPAAPEAVVKSDPDAILLVDVTGKGRAAYDSLLSNPAVASLKAVKDGKVKLFAANTTYAVGGRSAVDGLDAIARWLHPERF